MSYPVFRVTRFCRMTRKVLEVCADGVTRSEASALAASLRKGDVKNEDRWGYGIEAILLSRQAEILAPATAPAHHPCRSGGGSSQPTPPRTMFNASAPTLPAELIATGTPYDDRDMAALSFHRDPDDEENDTITILADFSDDEERSMMFVLDRAAVRDAFGRLDAPSVAA